jgi:hypothetical protein
MPFGLRERVIGAITTRLASESDLVLKGWNNGLADIAEMAPKMVGLL